MRARLLELLRQQHARPAPGGVEVDDERLLPVAQLHLQLLRRHLLRLRATEQIRYYVQASTGGGVVSGQTRVTRFAAAPQSRFLTAAACTRSGEWNRSSSRSQGDPRHTDAFQHPAAQQLPSPAAGGGTDWKFLQQFRQSSSPGPDESDPAALPRGHCHGQARQKARVCLDKDRAILMIQCVTPAELFLSATQWDCTPQQGRRTGPDWQASHPLGLGLSEGEGR